MAGPPPGVNNAGEPVPEVGGAVAVPVPVPKPVPVLVADRLPVGSELNARLEGRPEPVTLEGTLPAGVEDPAGEPGAAEFRPGSVRPPLVRELGIPLEGTEVPLAGELGVPEGCEPPNVVEGREGRPLELNGIVLRGVSAGRAGSEVEAGGCTVPPDDGRAVG